MMQKSKINSIGFFRATNSLKVFMIKEDEIFPFSDISLDVAQMLMKHLEKEPDKIIALHNNGIHEPLQQLEYWVGCNFSSFSRNADFVDGKRMHYTRGRCINRENNTCCFNQSLCDKGKLKTPEFSLTSHQVNILRTLKNGYNDTQTANILCMTPDSLRKHKLNLRRKLDLPNTLSLVAFAFRNC